MGSNSNVNTLSNSDVNICRWEVDNPIELVDGFEADHLKMTMTIKTTLFRTRTGSNSNVNYICRWVNPEPEPELMMIKTQLRSNSNVNNNIFRWRSTTL